MIAPTVENRQICRGLSLSTQLSTPVEKELSSQALSSLFAALSGAVEKCLERRSLY
jgi:hypothetical protein